MKITMHVFRDVANERGDLLVQCSWVDGLDVEQTVVMSLGNNTGEADVIVALRNVGLHITRSRPMPKRVS